MSDDRKNAGSKPENNSGSKSTMHTGALGTGSMIGKPEIGSCI